MSDTPRTDEEKLSSEIVNQDSHTDWWVEVDFARQLERELNAAKVEIKKAYMEGWVANDNYTEIDDGVERRWQGPEDQFNTSRAKRVSEGKE